MTEVRPTVSVLKHLRKSDKLPARTLEEYKAMESSSEPEARAELLARVVDIACQEVALLRDARKRFASGLPDQHRSMTKKAGQPVYEVRDTESPAWRGAVVRSGDEAAWLVYVAPHDRFHSAGPEVVGSRGKEGKLGPSVLDRRIQSEHQRSREASVHQVGVLESLVDALNQAVGARATVPVELPSTPSLRGFSMSLEVDAVDASQWDAAGAHEEMENLRIEINISGSSNEVRSWLLRICLPFLQPDASLRESVYKKDLSIQILMTRARLIQLLASSTVDLPTVQAEPPVPEVLHYTAKRSLVEAYVEGKAVQAVCGKWWIPIGDEATHGHLPICGECEREEPVAQYMADLFR